MWSLYMSLLCFFHFMEFFTTAVHQPDSLSYECKILCVHTTCSAMVFQRMFCISVPAYIVNHSKSYTIAALASWTEFWVEYAVFGGWKVRWWWVSALGVCLVLLGQVRT